VLPCYMSPEQIVTVTAAISILMAFLQPVHPSLTRAQTLQEQRISSLDKVITGTKAILQALFLLEHMLWPNQPPETPLHLVLPRESRPLSDLMLDSFDEFHDAVLNAIPEALIRVKLRFRNMPQNLNTNPTALDEDPQPANPSTPSTVPNPAASSSTGATLEHY
ncbi:unnamed protein product, partial [Cladocopium goreaui]